MLFVPVESKQTKSRTRDADDSQRGNFSRSSQRQRERSAEQRDEDESIADKLQELFHRLFFLIHYRYSTAVLRKSQHVKSITYVFPENPNRINNLKPLQNQQLSDDTRRSCGRWSLE